MKQSERQSRTRSASAALSSARVWRWVAGFAVSIIVGHHVGTIFKPLGEVGHTRWADWIDLLTPYAVLGCALVALAAAGADRVGWLLFAVGAAVYTQGHGIHLSANSIGNVTGDTAAEPITDVVHLWDEVMGHYVWYAGWILVVVALVRALVRRDRVAGPLPYVLAALYGLTWMTNNVEGGTPVLGLVAAAAFGIWGWRERARAGRHLLAAYGVALVLFAVFGMWQGGFPQFSELGWI